MSTDSAFTSSELMDMLNGGAGYSALNRFIALPLTFTPVDCGSTRGWIVLQQVEKILTSCRLRRKLLLARLEAFRLTMWDFNDSRFPTEFTVRRLERQLVLRVRIALILARRKSINLPNRIADAINNTR